MKALLVIYFLALFRDAAEGYSMGAPDAACNDMMPGHQHKPQASRLPANLTVSAGSVAPGEMLDLELTGLAPLTFMGFILQARDSNNKDRQVGSFVAGEDASYMTCGRGIHNSITHRTSQPKSSVKVQWRAPSDFEGSIIFRFTCLRDYATYWVGVETSPVRVTRDIRSQPSGPVPAPADNQPLVPSPPVDDVPTAADATDEKSPVDIVAQLKDLDGNSLEERGDLIGRGREERKDLISGQASDVTGGNEEEEEIEEGAPQPSQKADLPLSAAAIEDKVNAQEPATPIYLSSTTTLSPITTTMTTVPVGSTAQARYLTSPQDEIYAGCNTAKACFGIPAGCVATGKCEVVASYWPDKLQYHFQMKGYSTGYVALGLSRDERMGGDLTTNCILQENGNVDILTGYNTGYSGNKHIPRGDKNSATDGIVERKESGRRDGWIYCSWTRKREVVIEREIWDLEKDKYHVMLAMGRSNEGLLEMHAQKLVSGVPAGLGEVGLVQAKSRIYILLHGAFMIGAWICAASLGIILARYYKSTWTARKCCGLDQWFIWHRTFMMLAWSLTVVAFVLILVEVQGISSTISYNPHTIIGFVTVALAFIQPFVALLRCDPMHRFRWIFNWIHWIIGNAAQILGIVCIFFAVDLEKAQLPRPETDWLLIGFVAFHFLTHLIMSLINCVAEYRHAKTGSYPVPMRQLTHHSGHPYPDYEELKRDAPGVGLRIFLLIVYFIINVLVSAALILLVVLAPTRTVLEEIGILPIQT